MAKTAGGDEVKRATNEEKESTKERPPRRKRHRVTFCHRHIYGGRRERNKKIPFQRVGGLGEFLFCCIHTRQKPIIGQGLKGGASGWQASPTRDKNSKSLMLE